MSSVEVAIEHNRICDKYGIRQATMLAPVEAHDYRRNLHTALQLYFDGEIEGSEEWERDYLLHMEGEALLELLNEIKEATRNSKKGTLRMLYENMSDQDIEFVETNLRYEYATAEVNLQRWLDMRNEPPASTPF